MTNFTKIKHSGWALFVIFIFLLLPVYSEASQYQVSDKFPVLKIIEPKVRFWHEIFTKYNSFQAVYHDRDYPDVIYRVVDIYQYFPELKVKSGFDLSKEKKKRLNGIKDEIMARLQQAAKYDCASIDRVTGESRKEIVKILRQWCRYQNRGNLLSFATKKRIRFQWGMADSFKEGLKKVGKYLPHIENIFATKNLPRELVALGFIESMYQNKSISSVGAAGIWQLMPATGRQYLTINWALDQRFDPLVSTWAAATHIKKDYKLFKRWPLTLTAYNFGRAGIRRAIKKVGKASLSTIIARYRHRYFGFASKNFYAEFVAVLYIYKNRQNYFPNLKPDHPWRFHLLKLKKRGSSLRQIATHLQVSEKQLQRLNPGLKKNLRNSIWALPAGLVLRVPSLKADIRKKGIGSKVQYLVQFKKMRLSRRQKM